MTNKELRQTVEELLTRYQVVGTLDLTKTTDHNIVDVMGSLVDFHRDHYEPDQRIIVIMDHDFYGTNKNCGELLEMLQRQINQIDISNFFVIVVTPNPNIVEEFTWLQKNVSRDPIPMQFVTYDGNYNQLPSRDKPKFHAGRLQSADINYIKNLNESHRQLLQSDTFCMAPWTHLNITQTKNVKICCVSDYSVGDFKKESLRSIWNNEPMTELRRHMLMGQPHSACKVCYDREKLGKSSYRSYVNDKMMQHISRTDCTDPNGYLPEFHLNYLHFEINNLCNLTCRMCSYDRSSAWHSVAVETGLIPKDIPALITANDDGRLFDQLLKHLSQVNLIKFTGGEPLMMQEFYDILDILLQQNRTDVELFYNTNLTTTRYRSRSIFDLWQRFEKVTVGASLDAEGSRGEYIRAGSKWDQIVKNREEMLKRCPGVDFFISATVNILNAWHLPDFHKSWVEKGLIRPQDFDVHLLTSPSYLRLHQAPDRLKQEIRNKYQEHLEWLRPRDTTGRSVNAFEFILSLINIDEKFNPDDFWSKIATLDQYHQTDLLSVFPELSCLPKSS